MSLELTTSSGQEGEKVASTTVLPVVLALEPGSVAEVNDDTLAVDEEAAETEVATVTRAPTRIAGAAGSGHSEEAKKYFESACDCVVKQIPILYPNPSDMPSNFKDEPEWIEASGMCIEKHNPKK